MLYSCARIRHSASRVQTQCNTAADKAQIQGYAQQYLKQIVRVLELVPPPMLLLFKTNDCLRHAERQLDAGVDSFVITLRYSLQAMAHERRRSSSSAGLWMLKALKLRLATWLLWLSDSVAQAKLRYVTS